MTANQYSTVTGSDIFNGFSLGHAMITAIAICVDSLVVHREKLLAGKL